MRQRFRRSCNPLQRSYSVALRLGHPARSIGVGALGKGERVNRGCGGGGSSVGGDVTNQDTSGPRVPQPSGRRHTRW